MKAMRWIVLGLGVGFAGCDGREEASEEPTEDVAAEEEPAPETSAPAAEPAAPAAESAAPAAESTAPAEPAAPAADPETAR